MQAITFYSYKGGVGRTLALVNLAKRLSDFGKKVVVLDFDLEAPGLVFKFEDELRGKTIETGIVDYIYEYVNGRLASPNVKPYSVELTNLKRNSKPIHLIAAGNSTSPEYWKKLGSINWQNLFYKPHSQGVNFILSIRKQIEEELKPDFLLIDSRTGISDISTLTLGLLANEIVIVSAKSKENLQGSGQLIRSLRSPKNAHLPPDLKIHFVLSRIPYSINPAQRGKEIEFVEQQKKELDIAQIHVIHSDPALEWEEEILIGKTTETLLPPLGLEYLALFEAIIHPHLTDKDFKSFEKIQEVETLLNRARLAQDSSEVIELTTKVLKIDKHDTEALELRGNTFRAIKNYEKAYNDFAVLFKLTDDEKHAIDTVVSLKFLKQYKNALELVDVYLIKMPDSYELFRLKYSTLQDNDESFEEGEKLFEQIIAKFPTNPKTYNGRAYWFFTLNRFDEAVENANIALKLDPTYSYAYTTLAEIEATRGNDDGFYRNLELSLIFKLKLTDNSVLPLDIYRKYKDESRFLNLIKKYNVEYEFKELLR